MTGSHRSELRLAMPALLLALLVPARAISLCCLDMAGAQEQGARHTNHGSKSHHGPEGEPLPGTALAPLAKTICVVLTTPAPALRERGRSADAAPEAGDFALAPTAGIGYADPPDGPARPRLTSLPHPAGMGYPHPLRL